MDRIELAVHRGEEAEMLLSMPMYQQAFDDVRRAMLEAWAALPDGNSEQARDLHRRVQLLASLKRVLETHMTTGKLSLKELEGRKRLFDFKRA